MPWPLCIRLQKLAGWLNETAMTTAASSAALRAGIILVPDFTLLALSAFVDTLRLAADEGDRSRQIRCSWRVMSEDGRAVRASNGLMVEPAGGLVDPSRFDYVVVVGGTLHRSRDTAAHESYLRLAAEKGVPLIGLCTGSFHLARAGLMDGYKACVSWLHREELAAEFPRLEIVADALFVFDRERITCAGGSSVIHLASRLVDLHLGAGASDKGLRIMLEDRQRAGGSPQPPPPFAASRSGLDPRICRAMLLIESSIDRPLRLADAAARLGISGRQLNRLFNDQLGCSFGAFALSLRLDRARQLVTCEGASMTEIATVCGFADAAHFSRAFRHHYNVAPSEARRRARAEVQ